jgi:hypothetical protein
VRRRWPARSRAGRPIAAVILTIGLPIAVLALVTGLDPQYKATATVSTASPAALRDFNAALDHVPNRVNPNDAARLSDVGDLTPVQSRVERRLRLRPGAVGDVSLRFDLESGDLLVTARTGRASSSQRLANAYARELIAYRAAAGRRALAESRAELRALRRLPRAQRSQDAVLRLKRRNGELRAIGGSGGLTLEDKAPFPREVASPRTGRDVTAAAVLGLMLGLTVLGGPAWLRRWKHSPVRSDGLTSTARRALRSAGRPRRR